MIGEALREKAAQDRKNAKKQARTEDDYRAAERENLHRTIEETLDAVSQEMREQLRAAAIAQLTEQGVPKQFLLDGLIKMEMSRLLKTQNSDGAERHQT